MPLTDLIGFLHGETTKEVSIRTFFDQEQEGQEVFCVQINLYTPGKGSTAATHFIKNVGKCTIMGVVGDQVPGDDTPPTKAFHSSSRRPTPMLSLQVSDGRVATGAPRARTRDRFIIQAHAIEEPALRSAAALTAAITGSACLRSSNGHVFRDGHVPEL